MDTVARTGDREVKTCADLLAEALKQNDALRALLSEVLETQPITEAARRDITVALANSVP